MKNRHISISSAVLFTALSISAGQASADYVSRASALCKSEIQHKYGSADQTVRVKFKAAMGNQVSPRLLMQVLPRNADSFKVSCDVDGRAWEVVSLQAKTQGDELRVAKVQQP